MGKPGESNEGGDTGAAVRAGPALRGAVARHERVRLLPADERIALAADLLAAAFVQVREHRDQEGEP